MRALQPGLPSPVAVPEGYNTIVIDLQDCFFTISLSAEDISDLPLVCHQKILNSLTYSFCGRFCLRELKIAHPMPEIC